MASDGKHLKEYQFKPGISGNPSGRPANSLKKFVQKYFQNMSEEDKIEFLKGIDPVDIWTMGEGKPKQDIDIEGEVVSKVISADE